MRSFLFTKLLLLCPILLSACSEYDVPALWLLPPTTTELTGNVRTGLVSMSSATMQVSFSAVDYNRSAVFCHFMTDTSVAQFLPTCALTSASTLTITAFRSNPNVTVRYYVVQFPTGTVVQRGNVNLQAGGPNPHTVAVDTNTYLQSQTLPIGETRMDTATSNEDEDFTPIVRADATNLSVFRGGQDYTAHLEWQTVTFESGAVTMKSDVNLNVTQSTTWNGAVSDLTNTWFMLNSFPNTDGVGLEEEYFYYATLNSNGDITAIRSSPGSNSSSLRYYAVTTRGQYRISSGIIDFDGGDTAATSKTTTIDKLLYTPSCFVLLTSLVDGQTSSDARQFGEFIPTLNGQQLTVQRYGNLFRRATVAYQVIEVPDG
ncbi:MAG: hypothetical protein KDK30_04480 [Leptospiraceae bacterium]|nr:hypothetical protein [Leptospiraceae bacterium]MCB1314394.1 hypothetical protein [Leptospiraceae bacterium]